MSQYSLHGSSGTRFFRTGATPTFSVVAAGAFICEAEEEIEERGRILRLRRLAGEDDLFLDVSDHGKVEARKGCIELERGRGADTDVRSTSIP